VWQADYEPFGKAIVRINTVENNLRFPGQYYDRETGLHYNYFRDYDPTGGRYVEADPIGLDGGMNLYAYVDGNPLSYVDPLGLDKTNWDNRNGGILHGPTNGNWGGQCWSGGQYSCGRSGVGQKPPTDSADACYKAHDLGYSDCEPLPNQSACKQICQASNTTMAGRYICEGKCPPENTDASTEQGCMRPCDQSLVKCLTNLPSNPRNWPMPPKPGTEKDSERFKQWAIDSFK
jgi:RHS repeat-associated protein